MELLKDLFGKSKEEKKIISISMRGGGDNFWCGYISNYTDEFFTFHHYTKYGEYDGVVMEKIVNIESVNFDNDYSNLMSFLILHHKEIYKGNEIQLDTSNQDTWKKDILEQQLNNHKAITKIEIEGDNIYSGFVHWIDEEQVILRLIDESGKEDGKSILIIEDITMIKVNDVEGRRRLLLYNWRKANS